MTERPKPLEQTDGGASPFRRAVRLRRLGRSLRWMSSTLTRRIIVLNLAGLVALMLGFLFLSQFRAGLIDARMQSLLIQGEIIAGAIANSATYDTDTIFIDPNHLLQLELGETGGLGDDLASPLEFSINPERVAPVLRRLVSPTRTRARVYDLDGMLLLDSSALYSRGDILRQDLPPVPGNKKGWLERSWGWLRGHFQSDAPPVSEIGPAVAKTMPEVQQALRGNRADVVRVNARGETIVSVAVPIQRSRTVRGVLLLSTEGGDIDGVIFAERMALLRVFLVAALVMIVLSSFLAGSIVVPVRRLAEAAERVRRGTKARQEIPDFTDRSDEIGHLSGALRDMTQALYNRIEAIESFAADVAHELKNPLTSVRSAVETLPLAKSDDSKKRLLSIIQHDVKRLDRLITDISDASRLDAELARDDAQSLNLSRLLEAVAAVFNERRRDGDPLTVLSVEGATSGKEFVISGHDSRLGQVFNNLIDNARSFSPPGGTVRVSVRRNGSQIETTVEDDGPGIPAHAIDRVFERFYTDRPEQGFGQNSGLGLSISRQIVEAHGGTIHAENRYAPGPQTEDEKPLGARFIVRLPASTP